MAAFIDQETVVCARCGFEREAQWQGVPEIAMGAKVERAEGAPSQPVGQLAWHERAQNARIGSPVVSQRQQEELKMGLSPIAFTDACYHADGLPRNDTDQIAHVRARMRREHGQK